MFPKGAFVQVANSADGIGKLLSVENSTARIEYFVSPAGPEVRELCAPVSSVRLVQLSPQTRVFHFDGSNWRAGRVELPRGSGYHVSFPNGRLEEVSQTSLYTRWAHPIEDPTNYLAARVTDTPFFFDGRAAIVRYFASQRSVFGGLTGLVSSGIELLEHQIAIVRRILSDPIQRYLLADEVGLGKTIEAGVLIRQHLIDYSQQARVLVVVPGHLVPQWRRELISKFFLGAAPVALVNEEEVVRVVASRERLTLLVVDEAHRAARGAFSATSTERRLFETLRDFARRTPRLLLLSGTPVLNQEDDFLAMLHLLDPDGYPLEEREAFRRRVRDRQVIAEAIADLSDDSVGLFVEDAVARLEQLFADDIRLLNLCRDVRATADDVESAPARRAALRNLRTHVTETYRLHRRLLRTRREDRRLLGWLPERTGVTLLEHEDPARAEAFDFIETWRGRLPTNLATTDAVVRELCAVWVLAALSDPRVLLRKIDTRIALRAGQSAPVAPSEQRIALAMPWAFEGEAEFLKERRALIAERLTPDARSRRLGDWLIVSRDVRKVVVFVDDSEVANSVGNYLAEVLGERTVVRHTPSGNAERSFLEDQRVRVLVCDARAEEGLNLQQVAAALVHYDLPLAAARVEQRIGRIDRIAARGRMRNFVLLSGASYEREWFAYLSGAIRIFNRSVAPLQYVLAASATRILAGFLVEGPAAITTEAGRMSDSHTGCDAELLRIRQQETLDALESDPAAERAFFETLTAADEEADEHGREALDAWVIDRLQFQRASYGPSIFRYIHDMDRPTLIPFIEVVSRFRNCIDDAALHRPNPRARTLPMRLATFERHVAEEKQIEVLRVGHPFIDSMESLVRADDRGMAYAMWRPVSSWRDAPRLFFRFDFVVEADLSQARALLESFQAAPEALRRRAQAAFPMIYRRVWLDSDLCEVQNESLLGILDMPYSSRKPRADGCRDVNIRAERWPLVDAMLPIGDWDELCHRARTTAENLIRRDPEFRKRCRQHADHTLTQGRHIYESLQSRIARLSGFAQKSEQAMASLELTLSEALSLGIEAPSLRADSAGAIFLASQPLKET